MSDIRNLLTAKDYALMDMYREAYASENHNYRVGYDMVASSELLAPWAEAKGGFLSQLFDNQLILSREISLRKSYSELYDDFATRKHIHDLEHMVNEIDERLRRLYAYHTINEDELRILRRLIAVDSLLTNEYNGVNVKIGEYRLTHGCKLMKALKQLNGILHFMEEDEFEQFRICQSMCTNTAVLNGKLCLSIHPLDYMTMSDNDCDWSSCMSWKENGCYRMGTVEMMNSPCVVVAYLESSHPMRFDSETTWNNKKWRSLYIVTPDVVTNIKSYPYYDSSIDKIVTCWLFELMSMKSQIGTYEKPYTYEYPAMNGTRVRFETDYMYNDFGCGVSHWGFKRKGIGESLTIKYSGTAQCMVCGDTDTAGLAEDSLVCDECEPRDDVWYCEECGCRLHEDDVYFIGGGETPLCEHCYQKYGAHDCLTDEDNYRDRMMPLIYLPASIAKTTWADTKVYLDEYIKLRECYDVAMLYITSPDSYVNWDVTEFESDKRQRMYEYIMQHPNTDQIQLCTEWENSGGWFSEMAHFIDCWDIATEKYTNNDGKDLPYTNIDGTPVKSIFLYKGYLVINTEAMYKNLEDVSRDAFYFTDRYAYARWVGSDDKNRHFLYTWFKNSDMLNANGWQAFDF